ncbi:MAG TPA: hypothetical protein VLS90_03065, partial [Thermodesulfobacteriota bacterium]|nr:hypothetical protein [Thermodesulfobacteriota bacterium]
EGVDPRITLRLLPPETTGEETIASILKKNLSADLPRTGLAEKLTAAAALASSGVPSPAARSIENLMTFVKGLSSGLFSGDAAEVSKALNASGVFWENKVGTWAEKETGPAADLTREDLKALAAKALAELTVGAAATAPGDSARAQDGKQGIEALLRKIELFQILNLPPPDGGDRFHFFLPFWMENRFQFVELNLDFPKKAAGGGRDRREASILFLLQLPALGKIRIEVQVKDRDLFCRFLVSGGEISEFVSAALPGLEERMRHLGYRPFLQAAVAEGKKLEEGAADMAREISPGLFNIVI